MKKQIKRVLAIVLCAIMLVGTLPMMYVGAMSEDEFNSKLDSFKSTKFPSTRKIAENELLAGGYQCFGFANEAAQWIFGSYPTNIMDASNLNSNWSVVYGGNGVDTLHVGDVVRYWNHSIFITGLTDSTVYYAHAYRPNQSVNVWSVSYNNSISRSELRSRVDSMRTNVGATTKGWVAHCQNGVETEPYNVQPGKSSLIGLKSLYNAGENITFNWTSTENTTHYNLVVEKQNESGAYKRDYRKDYASSGEIRSFDVGHYRAYVQSYNSNYWASDGSDWLYTESEYIYFTVVPTNVEYETVTFGSYPQSKVTNSSIILALNGLNATWKSYGYYTGDGAWDSGVMGPSDYMMYTDVIYDGNKYRGVIFDSYRPYNTGFYWNDEQHLNGYYTGTVYWFKYEPIRWRVLDSATGLIMTDSIIDSQAFNNYVLASGTDKHGNTAYWGDSSKTYYANNYACSSIRQWLNDDFYNTAFSDVQKSNIKTTTLNNDSFYTLSGIAGYEEFDVPPTTDKVFLLSYSDATNSKYGFYSSESANQDEAGSFQGSDYAQCQGLYNDRAYDGYSPWLLRTPNIDSMKIRFINSNGGASYACNVNHVNYGICPALRLQNLQMEYYYIAKFVVDETTVFTKQYKEGDTIVKPADPVKENYTFKGWSPDVPSTMPSNDLTFTAIFEKNPITLTSISVKTLPTKTTYNIGESFDQSGLTLTATYSDGSTKTISSGFTCSGFSSATAGTKTITVTYEGKTTTFNVTVVKVDEPNPTISIHNFTANKTVDYKTTITFSADVKNAVSGAAVHWFIDGQDKGASETYTVEKAKESFTVQVKYMKDGKTLAESGVEKVSVKTGFFAKLLAFFRSIFGALPKVVQGYLGAEIIEKFI